MTGGSNWGSFRGVTRIFIDANVALLTGLMSSKFTPRVI